MKSKRVSPPLRETSLNLDHYIINQIVMIQVNWIMIRYKYLITLPMTKSRIRYNNLRFKILRRKMFQLKRLTKIYLLRNLKAHH